MLGSPHNVEGRYVSMNLSPESLVSGAFGKILTHTSFEDVVMEITEHAPVDDYELLSARIAEIRDRGGLLAIDDAGAGYSSLKHILRLQPEIVKLDIGLVRDIDTDPARQALAASLLSFTLGIGATIVAEGIETLAELDTLRRIGIQSGQGFFLGMPAFLPV